MRNLIRTSRNYPASWDTRVLSSSERACRHTSLRGRCIFKREDEDEVTRWESRRGRSGEGDEELAGPDANVNFLDRAGSDRSKEGSARFLSRSGEVAPTGTCIVFIHPKSRNDTFFLMVFIIFQCGELGRAASSVDNPFVEPRETDLSNDTVDRRIM